MLGKVVEETGRLVDGVTPDQLGNKTPCVEWTVRDLINHVTGGATMFALCAEKGSVPDEEMGRLMGGDNLGDDFQGAFHAAASKAMAAYQQPGIMEKVVKLPFGEMPAGVALNIAIFDVATHACDLAVATGQPVPNAEMLATTLQIGRQMVGPELRQPGMFDPEQTPADSAGPADQLLAFAGRRV